ncbi:hypothetical protein HZS_1997, partial [Henneguya salminicola]
MYTLSHARKRRCLTTNEFQELSKNFPAPESIKNNFDRLQLMRLINGYIKTKHFLHDYNKFRIIEENPINNETNSQDLKGNINDILKSFVLVVAGDSTCLCVSDNFVFFTGISPENIIGKSIYEFIYPADYQDISNIIESIAPHTESNIFEKIRTTTASGAKKPTKNRVFENSKRMSTVVRIKYALTTKGKRVRLGASEYKPFKLIGNLKRYKIKDGNEYEVYICVGSPLYFSSLERPILMTNTLITRTTFDTRLIYTTECNFYALGYENIKWIDKSLLLFIYGKDVENVIECYKNVLYKYECDSKPFRIVLGNQGWIWFKSRCFMVYDKSENPIHVLSIHEKLSEVENVKYGDVTFNRK